MGNSSGNITSYYGSGTEYTSCPLIENALPTTGTAISQYDALGGSGGSIKDWYRTPDGTGPWNGAGTSNPGNTSCGTNNGTGAGTFGLVKLPGSTVVPTNSNFTYTLYSVNGATAVSSPASVVVTDDLAAAGLTFVSCTTSRGTCVETSSGSNVVNWTVGAVGANTSYSATLTVKATSAGSKTNTITSNVGSGPSVFANSVPVTVFNAPVNYGMDQGTWTNGTAVADIGGTGVSGTVVLSSGSASSTTGIICTGVSLNLGVGEGIQIADNSAYDISSNGGTISFWIKPTDNTNRYVFAKKDEFFAYLNSSGKLVFGSGNNGLLSFLKGWVTSATTIPTGSWTHVALVYDSTATKAYIYINGALDATSGAITAPPNGTANLLIGSLDGTTWLAYELLSGRTGYSGVMDEFKIFKAAFASGNVWSLYQNELAGKSYDGTTRACGGGLDHIRAYLDNSTAALTCTPRSVSAIACGDSTCSTRYSSSASVTLNPGGTAATIPANGTGTPSVATVTAGTASITLNTSTPSTAGSPAFRCYSGTVATPGSEITGSCNLTFSDAGLYVNVPHHRSCDSQTLTITAAKTDDTTKKCVPAFDSGALRDIKLRFAYGSPNSGSVVPTVGSALPPTTALATGSDQTLSLAFTGGIATTNFRYQDAGRLTITASYSGSAGTGDAGLTMGTVLGNASYLNPFVVAPQNLVLSGIPAAPLLTAGSPFNVTVTAMNNCSPAATTQNFAGTVVLSSSNPQPGIGNASAISQNITVSSGGTASANATWNEVGTIDLSAATTNYLSSGLDVTTASATTTGRFKPGYFDTFVTHGCSSTFTYGGLTGTLAGQPFTVQVKAKRSGGTASDSTNTANYAGATWARDVTLADAAAGTGAFTNNSLLATAFASGIASRNDITYTFADKLTGPFTLAIRATDTDSVSSSTHTEGSTEMRSGRLRLSNAFGSEKSNLSMPVQAQYWSGKSWVPNGADSCTSLPANAFFLSGAAAGTAASAVPIASGAGTLTLTKPTVAAPGTVDVAADLGTSGNDVSCLGSHGGSAAGVPWLRSQNGSCAATYDRDPSARATFGLYAPETRRNVHVREQF